MAEYAKKHIKYLILSLSLSINIKKQRYDLQNEETKERRERMQAITIILILIFIIFTLIVFAIIQLQMAGIPVKDFWSFIDANQELDKLYAFSKKYEKMSPQEQIIFLRAAEKMSDAFDKVPSMLWEDDYGKYKDIMDIYRKIRVSRWQESGDGVVRNSSAK